MFILSAAAAAASEQNGSNNDVEMFTGCEKNMAGLTHTHTRTLILSFFCNLVRVRHSQQEKIVEKKLNPKSHTSVTDCQECLTNNEKACSAIFFPVRGVLSTRSGRCPALGHQNA